MKPDTKSLTFIAFYWMSIAVGAIVSSLLNKYCASSNTLFPVVGMVMLACAVLFCVVNIIAKRRMAKSTSVNNLVVTGKDVQNEYVTIEKSLTKSKNLMIVYTILLSFYFLSIVCIFAIGAGKETPLAVISMIIALIVILVYPLLLYHMFPFAPERELPLYSLQREDYPLIFSVVDQVKTVLKCSNPYMICMEDNCDTTVFSYLGTFYVSLNAEEVAILTRDELYQQMLYQFAREINRNTKFNSKLKNFESRLSCANGSFSLANLFFPKQLSYYLSKVQTYDELHTRLCEQRANNVLNKLGNPQIYLNGNAKILTFGQYQTEFNPEMNFFVYQAETFPQNYLFKDIAVYEKFLTTHGEKWDYILRHSISDKKYSTTFSMQARALGITQYDCKQREKDPIYVAEQQKLLKSACDILVKKESCDFASEKEEYYIPSLEKLKQYQLVKENQLKLSLSEKIKYIQLFYTVDCDECLKLCNEVLEEFPQNGYANAYKGFILAQNLDNSCIDYLCLAGETNTRYSQEAYTCVGIFAQTVGDEELLARYRQQIVPLVSDIVTRWNAAYDIDTKQSITSNALPGQDFENILKFLLQKGKNIISKIYSVSIGEKVKMRTYYYIETAKKINRQEVSIFLNDVFGYFEEYISDDGTERKILLLDKISWKKTKKIIKGTKGALIFASKYSK